MRKIKTKNDIAKEERKNQLILAIVFISLLVLSTAGYSFASREDSEDQSIETQKYNGITFLKQNDYWTTNLNNQQYTFNYLPNELDNIKINITQTLSNYSSKPLYIVNPNKESNKLISNLQSFIQRYQEASIQPTERNIPIKNCSIDNIIIYTEKNETSIYQKENCIFIEGNFSQATDKFIYNLFEIY